MNWPDATLVILGDGRELQTLKALAKALAIDHAVSFKGHVNHHAVFRELLTAEVFLFMSTKSSERLPNVVKEAMGSRCVCVATNTPGIEELLVHGKEGFVVPQGDVETAARFIEQAFADAAQREVMVEAAHLHVKEDFDLERIMVRYCEHWRRSFTTKAQMWSRSERPGVSLA
jgi:colanic acid/amylovoran biosynthesis glycosyltransferase